MSRGKKLERNDRNFANVVLNHIDNNNNSDPEVNNGDLPFSNGNDTKTIEIHNDNSKDPT